MGVFVQAAACDAALKHLEQVLRRKVNL